MRCESFIKQLCLALLLLTGTAASAQRYPFYNLGIEQGLIQSQGTALAQDKAGHLWIGTLGGLSRYDGHSFTNYSVRDGLPSNTIQALATGPDGRLWVGTGKGLVAYNGKKFESFIFQSAENPQGNIVSAIAPAADGTTWCIAGRKLYQVRDNKVQSVQHPSPDRNATALLSKNGVLYLALSKADSLYRYAHGSWTGIPLLPAGKSYSVTRMYEDHQHRLWLLTTAGLCIATGDQLAWYQPPAESNGLFAGMNAMVQAQDGSFWVGTRSGVVRFTDTTIRAYRKKNGLTDNSIFTLLNDAEGNIWIASDGQGLFRFSGAPFTALDESLNLPSAQIMGLAADNQGSLYLGTYDAGLYRYNQEKIEAIPFPGNAVPTIVTLARDHTGSLWIGTRGEGLWSYRKDGFRQYSPKDYGSVSTGITALNTDEKDRLWIGLNEGAAVYEQDTFRVLPLRDAVVDFLPLGGGSALLATTNGLKLYKDELITPYITGTEADHATPQCLARQGSYIWIGTNDNGLIAFDTATRKAMVINKASGLRSDFIYNLFAAADGLVWAGTGYGIYSIRMDGRRPQITFYGRGQGMTGLESNHNAVLGMNDGSIWFGTTNGAMHYRPGITKTSPRPVSIVLQSVKLFGEHIADSSYYTGTSPYYAVPQNLQLPYQQNNLTFTFQAIALSDETGITYRYQMEGLETQWSEWAPTNTVTYSALPPGNYSLQVECRAPGNPISAQTLSYPFRIIAPFHKTGLFRLLVLAGCILLGISLQYIANRRKSARLQMIAALRREEQDKIRERTAEDFHDEVGNKITRINVLTNVLKGKLGSISPDAERIISQIQDNTGQLYSGTRDILWSLKPSNDTLYEIIHRVRDFGLDLFGDTEISFVFSGTDERWQQYRLSIDISRNVIMIFKEAMNNCLKYAAPQHVHFTVRLDGKGQLFLELKDDGKGFDPATIKRGNGLANMNTRAKRLDGALNIITSPGNGTTMLLSFHLKKL